ncbi:MAG: hypothetical protein V1807_02970 [Patescibacteria group bacterium]
MNLDDFIQLSVNVLSAMALDHSGETLIIWGQYERNNTGVWLPHTYIVPINNHCLRQVFTPVNVAQLKLIFWLCRKAKPVLNICDQEMEHILSQEAPQFSGVVMLVPSDHIQEEDIDVVTGSRIKIATTVAEQETLYNIEAINHDVGEVLKGIRPIHQPELSPSMN